MSRANGTNLARFGQMLQNLFLGPQLLAFLPALTLGGYWFGGEMVLLFIAVLVPAIFAASGAFSRTTPLSTIARDGVSGAYLRDTVISTLDQLIAAERTSGRTTACLVVELDDFKSLLKTYGSHAGDNVIATTAQRVRDVLRESDVLARIDGPCFAIALGPMRRTDLETLIQLAARIQASIAQPFSIDATRVHITASVGFCLPGRAPARNGAAYLGAAESALLAAQSRGPGSIRAYSKDEAPVSVASSELLAEVEDALESGQIRPFFQPQVSTDTGEITGFEALARWHHPMRGMIPPGEFLPVLDDAGLFERLSEVILYHSMIALKDWEKAGYTVPNVAVNLSSAELSNPKLAQKIRWDLDRFDLAPDRLTVEILEDVIASSENDAITRNIWELSEMGCGIDLDDFGTGHASLANIRRFAVSRIKIDRSYVTRVDTDRDQQNMVAAILTMAERLNLDTLAEGVETLGEHSMLSQLGCGHVQGFSVARPMSFEDTIDWMSKHQQKLAKTPTLGRRAS